MNTLQDSHPLVVGLGEVLWDVFPDGRRFGGAPANFACSLAALSDDFEVAMVSGIGTDDLGSEAESEFRQRGVSTASLQWRAWPTGVVNVSVDAAGIASYDFANDCAWDDLQWTTDLEDLAQRVNAACFGSLGQRSKTSASTIQRFVATCSASSLKIFDINLRPPFVDDRRILESLAIANCLKLNEDELPYLARLSGVEGSIEELLQRLADRWQLHTIALTLGAEGARLLHHGQSFSSPGIPVNVRDTVGAGDAFTAAMAIGLLRGEAPQRIIDHACQVAAFVCSQVGATPRIPDHLRY